MSGSSHNRVSQQALLIKDGVGDKVGAWYTGYRRKKDHHVLRGSILQPLSIKEGGMTSDGKPVFNYKVYKEDVSLYCDGQVIAPLTNHELSLLVGIKVLDARYKAFINDILEWGVTLKVGMTVFVTLPSKLALSTPHHSCQAIIRWIGMLYGEEGLKFGVEITDQQCYGAGSTDGFFQGQQLFQCAKNNGLFVTLDRLAPSADCDVKKTQTLPSSLQNPKSNSRYGPTADNPKPSAKPDVPANNTRSSRSVPPPLKFQTKDRVVAYNKDQVAIHGTVRWTGLAHTSTEKVNIVGIETDVSVSRDEFECAFTAYLGNFKCSDSRHGKVVLPEGLVQTVAEATNQKRKAQDHTLDDPHKTIGQEERKMLKDVGIESIAMNPQEQEKMMQEYKDQQKNAPSSSFLRQGSGQVGPTGPQMNSEHIYEPMPGQNSPRAKHGYPSSSSGNLQRYNSTPAPGNGSTPAVENELRRANIETQAFDKDEQARMLNEYKQQQMKQDGERKRESSGNPPAPSYDTPVDHPLKQQPDSSTHHNMPTTGGNRAFAAEGPVHKFHMNSKVEFSDPPHFGVIQWMGELPEVGGMVAGVELEAPYDGCSDGTRGGLRYFNCRPGHGFFCPVTALRPDRRESAPPKPSSSTPPTAKPRPPKQQQLPVDHGNNQQHHHAEQQYARNNQGILGGHRDQHDQHRDQSSQQAVYRNQANFGQYGHPNQHDQRPGGIHHPAYNNPGVAPSSRSDNPAQYPQATYANQPGFPNQNPVPPDQPAQHYPPSSTGPFTEGTAVEFGDPSNPRRGVIRWMGVLGNEATAGVELEVPISGSGDGVYQGTRYFQCEHGKGYFCKAHFLRPDSRFADTAQTRSSGSGYGNPLQTPWEEQNDQPPPASMDVYVGNKRGIQGNQNSCYLDSTLFGLFAMSDIFDVMFLNETVATTTDVNRKAISDMLWKGIVNPLRKYGVVRFEAVMRMRNKLDELGKMEGIAENEKDPEEFLNMLFKHVLKVPAFISIRRPFGVEPEFFVQLFLEPDPNTKIQFISHALVRMFKEQKISFTKIPSKLLLQVPRFGREYKTYEKMVPDLKLDISDVTDTFNAGAAGTLSYCMFCGEEATKKCSDCRTDFPNSTTPGGPVFYCDTCSLLGHKHKTRRSHQLEVLVKQVKQDDDELYQLDLLSVICIETSHYVCFTRDLNTGSWIFFDSMADREYDTYNIPKVTDCTQELMDWVYARDLTILRTTHPKQLPQLVRRFTQDAYLCVYVQPDVAMYGEPNESLASTPVPKTDNNRFNM